MAGVEYVTLATGARLPLVGLGTWLSKNENKLREAVHAALDAGYRLFDTAFLYQTEELLGNILEECFQSGRIKREDVFITSKLSFTAHAPNDVAKMVEQQLCKLKTDYIDLYLIHTPCPTKHRPGGFEPFIEDGRFAVDNIDHLETWRKLEELHRMGKLKAIGLSNFNEEQIQRICDLATIKPHNLQVEAHVYFPQHELHRFCLDRDISFTAYAPLGSPGRKEFDPNGNWPEGDPLKDPTVLEIASFHNKTSAQILLRYLVQRRICVIPKSTNPIHVRENIDIFDFELTESEMDQLNKLPKRVRLFIFE